LAVSIPERQAVEIITLLFKNSGVKEMRNSKYPWAVLIVFTITVIAIIPSLGHTQPMTTTCSEIVANPVRFDGKMVQVEGTVDGLFIKVSKRGNPYYTFKLIDSNGQIVNVFNFGQPAVKDGNRARVTGRYETEKQVTPRFTVRNQIDASKGSITRQ
jgi:hypothetical protein